MDDKCSWNYNERRDIWASDCGREWVPLEKTMPVNDMKFCVFRGKPIDVVMTDSVK